MAGPIKTVAINIRPNDQSLFPFIEDLVDFFSERGIRVLLPDYDIFLGSRLAAYSCGPGEYLAVPDLAIVIGGDGTFLHTARLFAENPRPIFGINRGRLGFLTEFSPHEARAQLDRVLAGDYTVTGRALLEATHRRRGEPLGRWLFLNDAVVTKGSIARMIRIRLDIDGEFLNLYSGDGLIIATATGSTAYSLSAGGPIVIPSIGSVCVINPICPHMLAVRSMIVSTKKIITATIESEFDNLLLTIDGQIAIPIRGQDTIDFTGSEHKVLLITHPQKNYYDILREKLGWGQLPEQ